VVGFGSGLCPVLLGRTFAPAGYFSPLAALKRSETGAEAFATGYIRGHRSLARRFGAPHLDSVYR